MKGNTRVIKPSLRWSKLGGEKSGVRRGVRLAGEVVKGEKTVEVKVRMNNRPGGKSCRPEEIGRGQVRR